MFFLFSLCPPIPTFKKLKRPHFLSPDCCTPFSQKKRNLRMDLHEYEEAESVAYSEESLIRLTSNSIVGLTRFCKQFFSSQALRFFQKTYIFLYILFFLVKWFIDVNFPQVGNKCSVALCIRSRAHMF